MVDVGFNLRPRCAAHLGADFGERLRGLPFDLFEWDALECRLHALHSLKVAVSLSLQAPEPLQVGCRDHGGEPS
jgi:hypothetical protein